MTTVVTVGLGERSYPVVIGHGASASLGQLVPERTKRIAVVTQPGVPYLIGDFDAEVEVFEIGVGETHKNLATIEMLNRKFARWGMTRSDLIIGLGGGMVTDVAGFAAACYHRGIPVIHVATTLLGMVDAAIGGKTGVNLPEGKNLVGAFWQPVGVVCDLDALSSLPEREMRCGTGEMAKYHFLTGDDLAVMPLEQRVARSVEIKAEIVVADEREGGQRALLNYGHTLAHALEIATDHSIAHGEAVGIGLVFAARLSASLGRIDERRVEDHLDVVGGLYGLETALPAGVEVASLLELMERDKKALDGLTFVLDGPVGLEVCSGISPDVVVAALEAMPSASP
jgi:5-deoxy-5-amino-3-dehydroquinate synthase